MIEWKLNAPRHSPCSFFEMMETWLFLHFDFVIFQVNKIHSSNSVPSCLIQEGHQVIRLRSTLQSLMERCSNISNKLESFISDVASQKSVDSLDNSRSYVLQQPDILVSRFVELKKYFAYTESDQKCLEVWCWNMLSLLRIAVRMCKWS